MAQRYFTEQIWHEIFISQNKYDKLRYLFHGTNLTPRYLFDGTNLTKPAIPNRSHQGKSIQYCTNSKHSNETGKINKKNNICIQKIILLLGSMFTSRHFQLFSSCISNLEQVILIIRHLFYHTGIQVPIITSNFISSKYLSCFCIACKRICT